MRHATENKAIGVIVSAHIHEAWLACVSSAKVIVVANPVALYPCVPSFLMCRVAGKTKKSSFSLLPYTFSQSPRLPALSRRADKNLGTNPRPKPFSQVLVHKPMLVEVEPDQNIQHLREIMREDGGF